jgi:hypothetical protein
MEYADVCQPTNLAADAADFPFRVNVFPGGLVEGEGDEVSVEEVSFATYCLDSYKGSFSFFLSLFYLGLRRGKEFIASTRCTFSILLACFPFELVTFLRLPCEVVLIYIQRMSSSTPSIQPTISISNPPTPGSEEAAVLAVVEALLDAVPLKDSAKLLACCYPGCSAARKRGPELLVETLEAVCTSITAIEGELWEGFIEPDVKVCLTSQLAA